MFTETNSKLMIPLMDNHQHLITLSFHEEGCR